MSRSKTHAVTVAFCIAISLAAILPASCSKKSPDDEKKTAQKSEDDFLDKDAKPDQRKYLLAAKPFFIAVAGRKYADAYALLPLTSLSLLTNRPLSSNTNRNRIAT
jgi:hypothetical protein